MEERPKNARSRWKKLSWGGSALILTALFTGLSPIARYKFGAPDPAGSHMLPLGALAALFSVCLLNALRGRKGLAPLLTPGETFGFFLIILAGSWTAGWGMMWPTMPLLTAPHLFATPQNQWAEYVLPLLPGWALGPTDEPYLSAFYVGLSQGAAIPWALWLVPVVAWSMFTAALVLFSIGLSGILSRRWVEHDRLTFPIAEVIGGMVRGFMSDRRFWIGAGIAAVIPVWNITQRFLPVFQKIPTYFTGGLQGLPWLEGAANIAFPIDFGLLGLLYFVHADIVISTVIFFFLIALEDYFLMLAGVKLLNTEFYFLCESPVDWQMGGALFAFVLMALWVSRGSIRDCVRDALKGNPGSACMWLSPRLTIGSLLAGGAFIALWMLAMGITPVGLAAFMASQVVNFIGLARIAAESGMELNPNVDPMGVAVMAAGTKAIGAAGIVALVVSFGWIVNTGLNPMVKTMHAERFNSASRLPRATFPLVLAAVIVGTAVTMLATAWLAYKQGANSFLDQWTYKWHPRMAFDQAASSIQAATGPDMPRLLFFGIGAAAMIVLAILRGNVVGWFLHPVGLLLGHQAQGVPSHPGATELVFIGLAAWSAKKLILKLGGVEAHEKYRPFFAGLVVGAVIPALYALLVNLIAGPKFN